MKKLILVSIMALAVIFKTGANMDNVNAQTIYTSMPDQDDTYYQPFESNLRNFNTDLQDSATGKDKFVTLDIQKEDFNTKNFYYPDIWLRDVAPVITTKMVKFRYSPNYLKKSDSKYLNNRFNKFLKGKYHYSKSDLILDGGNLQWNGAETVILTKQVFTDNPELTKAEIISELQYQLNVKKVIFISKEPGDVLGHSDGMVKFMGKDKMFINDFSYEPGFLKKVEKQILEQEPNMKFIVLPSSYTSKGQFDKKIASAKGLYINMLETSQAIYFPIYHLKDDQRVMKLVQSHTDKKVIPINVSKISTLGGSVHCLTWDVPDKFRK